MLIIQLAYTFVSARLLKPEDFGPYALAVSTAQVASYFVGSGVVQAVLQAPRNDRQCRTAATSLVLAAGAVVGLLLSALGLWVVLQVKDPVTGAMVLVLAWMPVAAGTSGVATASMRRSNKFKLPAFVEAMGLFCGLALSMVCIVSGVGALSLAIGSIATPLISSTAAWAALKEVPKLRLDLLRGNPLLSVARNIAGQNLVHYVQYTLPLWTLGTTSASGVVGHYSRAQSVATIPLNQLSQAFTRVVYPHLAKARHSGSPLAAPITKSLSMALSLAGIVFGMISGLAEPLTLSFLGDQWRPAIVLTSLWGIFTAVNLCYVAAGSALESQGRFTDIWRVQVISLTIMIPIMIVIFILGVDPVRILLASIAVQMLSHLLQVFSLWKHEMVQPKPLVAAYIHGTFLFLAVAGTGSYSTVLTRTLNSDVLSLALGGCAAALAAAAFIACTYHTNSTKNIIELFKDLKKK
jgi:PST family polysaccharide transporter